jgi:hypothetical protein
VNYYTYIYYDPSRGNEPFYIGKGHGNRAWSHLKSKHGGPFMHRLRKMLKSNIVPNIGLYAGLEEEFAFLLEMELISKFGRKNLGLGPLLNLTNGGEGNAGLKHSDETKRKMSETRKGHPGYMLGKSHSRETKAKMSKAHSGENNHFYGKAHKEETKNHQSKVMKGKMSGDKNPFYGKQHPKEIQDRISTQNIGRTHSDETKRKIGEASRNRVRKPFSEEAKRKMSEAAKSRWTDK